MATRKVLRMPDVMASTGWKRSTVYAKIASGDFPAGQKLDPKGHARTWFEDEVEAWQKGEWRLNEQG